MSNRRALQSEIELLPVSHGSQSADSLITIPHVWDEDSATDSEQRSFNARASLKSARRAPARRGNARLEGWKFTILMAFLASLVVLFFNVGFLIYTAANPQKKDIERYSHQYQVEYNELGKHHGRNTVLYEGDCEKVHHLGVGLHLLINLLSTSLLSASNYGMQCLAAPTRQVIDKAHKAGRWLDIGVPSVRNLFRVSKGRSVLWLCLAFSSLPFHLIYNSAIYQTTAVSAYDVFAGSGSLAEKDWPDLNLTGTDITPRKNHSLQGLFYAAQNGSKAVTPLSNNDCLNAFGKTYQSTYNKLLLINSAMENNNTYTFVDTQHVFNPLENEHGPDGGPYEWICTYAWKSENFCTSSYIPLARDRIENGDWMVDDVPYKVDSCLAQKAPQYCKLQYSLPLTLIVVGFNVVKSAILLYMWLMIADTPLLTIGDAIASFLRRPDPHSQGYCLLTHREVKYWDSMLLKDSMPEVFPKRRRRWGSAVSNTRWTSSISLLVVSITTSICLLVFALANIEEGIDIWKQELGAILADTLIKGNHWPNTLLPNVIIANAPQLIFSFIYFAFNSVLTAMTLAAEWSTYAIRHKGLRVSNNRQRSQQSKKFLSIPYRYSAPLLVFSGVLHWLISQSIFMVGIEAFDADMVRDPGRDLTTCGFSPLAMMISIIVGGVMFFYLVGLGFRRFKSAMPVAGSCSLAIAAACHPRFDPNCPGKHRDDELESENENTDMSRLPVRWGAVVVDGPIGHCSFTSEHVDEAEQWREYQ
ncbi:hypothetical protein N7457_005416 [Penicillium paradoxum]|uniref:uncharacterized protein n=1 Tax=Penicillium paradoxum TaxID=176176 RepID=UPI0025496A98|nr:uncharacterized protein N7457_005416 [Penicillium paradoxum]KAJ5780256.1 hypothetical protein N7457_005416 [Penicillium paradoxum]